MSRSVFTSWQTREDEEEFLNYLGKKQTILLPTHPPVDRPEPLSLTQYTQAPRRPPVLLTQERFLRQIEFSRSPDGVLFISTMDSPVLNHRSGSLRENTLVPANLYTYWDRTDSIRGGITRKDPEFCKWGHAIFAWLRKHTPIRDHALPMTNRVQDRLISGAIKIATY
ncbi:MAG TPA: hypothetical protein VHQ47_01830 [Phycisphaerae bacterium]|nr:hypothetical protein [Phycisphaerae bacterium]